ncbi:hypothetical protein KSC_060220 [Ktedonobacter sp. SOSP1-52]|uniref:glycosyltransferase family 39 protein n=1 Tax=Ktedonobacter sp. SOSP1-52 TaxID=2778366 RepID=UPI0019154847|nr:glycosyltransferase family 39 protein [Ktedonobacter sp. SOSP1-52]GHO67130.1 hypothetical protein KSC_060220 [Ktedonobacter sp. SOSP1-52]
MLKTDRRVERHTVAEALPASPISPEQTPLHTSRPMPLRAHALLPAMLACFLLLSGAFSLQGLMFFPSLLGDLFPWTIQLSHLLFPGQALNPRLFHHNLPTPSVLTSWTHTLLVAALFLLIGGLYLLALRILPQRTRLRVVFVGALLLGLIWAFMPIVTSADLFSYIAYARMGVIYHLNPLIQTPHAIWHDPVYINIYWTDQPSVYGPVYTGLTYALQWLCGMLFGTQNVAVMVLALRLLDLATHLGSIWLIWSIGGYLQGSKQSPRQRMLATLAFAWNPLLLFEACVNAHNDTLVLFFILLALWFLVRTGQPTWRTNLLVALNLSLATCIKVNVGILLPGYLCYLLACTPERTLWQRLRQPLLVLLGTALPMVLLYAPFWDNGQILTLLKVNPGTYRAINTLPELLTHIINSLFLPSVPENGSLTEFIMRDLSLLLFFLSFAFICWHALRSATAPRTPLALIRWMALAWLLYMGLGSPWYWPWYAITFFGLFALVESATSAKEWQELATRIPFLPAINVPMAVHILGITMASTYCFFAWPAVTTFLPFLPGFRVAFLRSIWAWIVPLLLGRKAWIRQRLRRFA